MRTKKIHAIYNFIIAVSGVMTTTTESFVPEVGGTPLIVPRSINSPYPVGSTANMSLPLM